MYINIFALTFPPILEVAMTWLPIIILIAAVVACFIAVLIRVIYLILQLFPNTEKTKK